MEQELEVAQAYVAAKNYESAFNILHSLVSKDVKADDEEGVRVKEQAILDLGALLTQTKKSQRTV